MSTPLFRKTALAALVSAAASPGLVQAQSGATALEEVIVSAQRREQSLQDVPISIAAFSRNAIETYRIDNLLDLNTLVPNLSAVEGAGGTQSVLFQIRGLYASGTALGADSGVAIYQDGVYIQGGSGVLSNYADLERVEVLRGPQGTLFGRNTSGGAIHFITRDPEGEFGIRQRLTSGNLDLFESRTRIDSPQWGPISLSLDYTYRERDGEIRNSGAGFEVDFSHQGGGFYVSPEKLGNEQTDAMLLGVSFDLHEDLELVYKFDYVDTTNSPLGTGILDADASLLPLIGPSFGTERPDSVNNAFHLNSHKLSRGHNLTAEYEISDTLTLRNILSYRESSIDTPGFTLDGLGQFAPIVVVFVTNGGRKTEQLSEELQLIWSADSYTLTTGFLYYGLDQSAGGYNRAPNGFFGSAPPNLTLYPGNQRARQSEVETDSLALYGQWEYHITPEWDLLLGGRFTNDKKDYIDRTLMTGEVLEESFDEDETTYLVGFNYKPSADLLLYAKYSTGYISGGIVSGLIYDPETATSLEAGLKSSWRDNTLQVNLSLFSTDYEDQQFGTAGNLVDPPVPTSQVIVNAGDTSADGMELELSWLPLGGLTLGMDLGYLDFSFDTLDLDLLGVAPSPHLRPEWSGVFRADYVTEPVLAGANLRLHLDASYRSEEWAATRDAEYSDDEVNDETWRLNAQLALEGLRLGDAEFRVALWGRNLTDSDLPANMNVLGPIIAGTYEPPRTYGVDITFEY
jgi:iron complex outermembrane receptor protein